MSDFHDDIDRRITEALRAAAGQVDAGSLRPALSPRTNSLPPRRHVRWTAPLLAAAAVVAVVVGTVAVTSANSSSSPQHMPVGSVGPGSTSVAAMPPGLSTAQSSSGVPSVRPSSMGVPQRLPVSTTPPPPSGSCPFADLQCAGTLDSYYVPIWPFDTYAQARQWQTNEASTGSAPWHLDPAQTAHAYVVSTLGFTDLPDARLLRNSPTDAFVQVGFMTPQHELNVAATLHLVRYGPTLNGVAGAWEVVGTADDPHVLTLSDPTYGMYVLSPVTVGGTVTGVDESLVVTVRNPDGTVLGTSKVQAGGQQASWTTEVAFPAGTNSARVAVVCAGDALTQHSRFAIQGFYG